MASEVVYIGNYDNTIDLRLDSDGVAISLSSVTRIDANIEGIDITSTNGGSDLIRWEQVGFAEGEIRCKFGGVTGLTAGLASCYFIVFDPTNVNGVVFGPIVLKITALL